jgi:hypothetical protein
MFENIYFIVNVLRVIAIFAAGGFALYCLIDYLRQLL